MITTIVANQPINPAEFLDFLSEYGDCVKVLYLKTFASVFNDRQLIPFQSIRVLYVSEFQMRPNYELLLELKNLMIFELSTFPHFLSHEIMYLVVELFERNPGFKLFKLLSKRIRRNSDRPGLKYNGIPFGRRTPEEIYRIFLESLPYEDEYSQWCEIFGDNYLTKYKLLPI